jgi:hypothetical protein
MIQTILPARPIRFGMLSVPAILFCLPVSTTAMAACPPDAFHPRKVFAVDPVTGESVSSAQVGIVKMDSRLLESIESKFAKHQFPYDPRNQRLLRFGDDLIRSQQPGWLIERFSNEEIAAALSVYQGEALDGMSRDFVENLVQLCRRGVGKDYHPDRAINILTGVLSNPRLTKIGEDVLIQVLIPAQLQIQPKSLGWQVSTDKSHLVRNLKEAAKTFEQIEGLITRISSKLDAEVFSSPSYMIGRLYEKFISVNANSQAGSDLYISLLELFHRKQRELARKDLALTKSELIEMFQESSSSVSYRPSKLAPSAETLAAMVQKFESKGWKIVADPSSKSQDYLVEQFQETVYKSTTLPGESDEALVSQYLKMFESELAGAIRTPRQRNDLILDLAQDGARVVFGVKGTPEFRAKVQAEVAQIAKDAIVQAEASNSAIPVARAVERIFEILIAVDADASQAALNRLVSNPLNRQPVIRETGLTYRFWLNEKWLGQWQEYIDSYQDLKASGKLSPWAPSLEDEIKARNELAKKHQEVTAQYQYQNRVQFSDPIKERLNHFRERYYGENGKDLGSDLAVANEMLRQAQGGAEANGGPTRALRDAEEAYEYAKLQNDINNAYKSMKENESRLRKYRDYILDLFSRLL